MTSWKAFWDFVHAPPGTSAGRVARGDDAWVRPFRAPRSSVAGCFAAYQWVPRRPADLPNSGDASRSSPGALKITPSGAVLSR
jgi:hypothetical protein